MEQPHTARCLFGLRSSSSCSADSEAPWITTPYVIFEMYCRHRRDDKGKGKAATILSYELVEMICPFVLVWTVVYMCSYVMIRCMCVMC